MKHIASLTFVAVAFLGTIQGADTLTGRSISADYISGALDERIEELGTNKQSQERMPQWKSRQNGGLLRHCMYLKQTLGQDGTGCATAYARNGR